MFAPVASKIRSPSRPSIATRAKSNRLADCLAAVSIASNCRWVSPRVGDSAGHVGRRTYSAGRVLQDAVDDAGAVEARDDRQPARHRRGLIAGAPPATTADTARRVRRLASSGSRLRRSHQTRYPRRSDSVWTRDWPLNRARYAAAAYRSRSAEDTTISPATAGTTPMLSIPPVPTEQARPVKPSAHETSSLVSGRVSAIFFAGLERFEGLDAEHADKVIREAGCLVGR